MLRSLSPPVSIYFETENINTLSQNGELLLTVLAAFAQDESVNKSISVAWGIRQRFAKGIPKLVKPYGYQLEDNKLIVDEEEAGVVIRIFAFYLGGKTPYEIAKILTSEGIPHTSPVSLNSVVYEPEKGYIYFETPEDFVEGNAVIAAYDESGNVLWSWNIWAVEDYDPSADAVRSNGYTFMDRNLGAIRGMEVMDETDDRSAARAIGNYYQWGRKDPFPAAAECKDYDNNWGLPTFTPIVELQQDFSSQSWGSNDMMFGNVLKDNVYAIGRHVGENFTISEAVESGVKYPYKWVTSGPNDGVDENMKWRPDQSYSWMMNGSLADEYVTDWHYLWGNPGADDDRQKSIYDPCPAGWEIPGKDALQIALGKGTTDKPHGALIGGLYFPYAGQRNASFGGSKIVGLADNGISIWCSGFAPDNRVHPYKGFNTGVTVSNSYAGAGYQVRCIKTESNVPVEGGDLTADGGQKEEDWFE